MKTAMVWGAAGGIGRAVTEELIANDWNVIVLSRHESSFAGLNVHSLHADIASPFSVQQAIQAAAFEVDTVNLFVYAAGDITSSPVEDMEPDTWNRILASNLTGAYLTIHYSLPLLAPDAHIVIVGAISERLRLPGLSAYSAAKAGLEAFAEALRKEQRKRRVTLVRPSAVATALWDKVPMRMPKDSPPPNKVAKRILEAYQDGHAGVLDLA